MNRSRRKPARGPERAREEARASLQRPLGDEPPGWPEQLHKFLEDLDGCCQVLHDITEMNGDRGTKVERRRLSSPLRTTHPVLSSVCWTTLGSYSNSDCNPAQRTCRGQK